MEPRIRNRGIALAAVFILLALTVRTETACGAAGIQKDMPCSIQFDFSRNAQIPTEGEAPKLYEELYGKFLRVNLYKVADVNVYGVYTKPSENQALYETLKERLAAVNGDTTAAEWMEMAEMVGARTQEGAQTELIVVEKEISAVDSAITGLSAGLYLVSAETVETEEYICRFTPYLVSLPGYDRTDDQRLYTVTVGLKPGLEPRSARVVIEKTLKTYRETPGGASFVFHIKAEKDGEIVYNNVASLVFRGAGTRTLEIDGKIPAGSVVTVKEVYSGAGYRSVAGKEQVICSVSAYNTANSASAAIVRFVNDYDGQSLSGGTSVVNHFTYEHLDGEKGTQGAGMWKWEKLMDSKAGE